MLAEATGILVALMFFFCTGFVPLDQYPAWIQPVVEHQPMSYAIAVMQGLALGGPVLCADAGHAGLVARHSRGVRGADGDRLPASEHSLGRRGWDRAVDRGRISSSLCCSWTG